MATNYTYEAQAGQNLYDIALQEYGDIGEAMFALLQGNGLGFNSMLEAGQQLLMSTEYVQSKDVKAYYTYKKKTVCTGDEAIVYVVGSHEEEAIMSNDLIFEI